MQILPVEDLYAIQAVAFSSVPQNVYMASVASMHNAQFVEPLKQFSELVECEYCGTRYQREDMRGHPWKCWYGCGARLP